MSDPTLRILHWTAVVRAREWLRAGSSVNDAAQRLGISARALDLSLWRQMGRGFQ